MGSLRGYKIPYPPVRIVGSATMRRMRREGFVDISTEDDLHVQSIMVASREEDGVVTLTINTEEPNGSESYFILESVDAKVGSAYYVRGRHGLWLARTTSPPPNADSNKVATVRFLHKVDATIREWIEAQA